MRIPVAKFIVINDAIISGTQQLIALLLLKRY